MLRGRWAPLGPPGPAPLCACSPGAPVRCQRALRVRKAWRAGHCARAAAVADPPPVPQVCSGPARTWGRVWTSGPLFKEQGAMLGASCSFPFRGQAVTPGDGARAEAPARGPEEKAVGVGWCQQEALLLASLNSACSQSFQVQPRAGRAAAISPGDQPLNVHSPLSWRPPKPAYTTVPPDPLWGVRVPRTPSKGSPQPKPPP